MNDQAARRLVCVSWFIVYLSSKDADNVSAAVINKNKTWKDEVRIRKQLLDDLKGKRGYCKLKQAAPLDRNLWRTVLGRDFVFCR